MIAGQIAASHRQRRVKTFCEFEIVAAGRAIPADIAAVDDEVGTGGCDVFADAMEIIGQQRQTAGEVGVGNLGQSKCGHAILFLLLQS